jgi:hypothetical protein
MFGRSRGWYLEVLVEEAVPCDSPCSGSQWYRSLGRDSKEDKVPGGVDERRGTWERVVFGGGCVTDVLLFSAISFEDAPGIATQGKLSTQFERNAQLGDALKMQLPSTPLALGWPTSFIQVLGPSHFERCVWVREASIMPGVKWTTMVTERS